MHMQRQAVNCILLMSEATVGGGMAESSAIFRTKKSRALFTLQLHYLECHP